MLLNDLTSKKINFCLSKIIKAVKAAFISYLERFCQAAYVLTEVSRLRRINITILTTSSLKFYLLQMRVGNGDFQQCYIIQHHLLLHILLL